MMGRPRRNLGEQTQIRSTREVYAAIRKAGKIRRKIAAAYLLTGILQPARTEIVAEARGIGAVSEGRVVAPVATHGPAGRGAGNVE